MYHFFSVVEARRKDNLGSSVREGVEGKKLDTTQCSQLQKRPEQKGEKNEQRPDAEC